MTNLLLNGYKSRKGKWPIYELDTKTGSISTRLFESEIEGRKAVLTSGMGDFRKLGFWGTGRESFVAAYAKQGSLHLWLDGKDFDLSKTNVELKRGTDFLLRKHFQVFSDSKVVFESRYSYLDYEDFPDEDIFWWMTRSLSDADSRDYTLRIFGEKQN
jgi:hypothetical protein